MSEVIFSEIYLTRLKEDFDPQSDVDASPVRYATAVVNMTEYLLEKFDAYEEQYSARLAQIAKLNLPNEFKMAPGQYISNSREEIKKIQRQAATLLSELRAADDLDKLAALESKPRPSFTLVAEIIVEKVQLTVTQTPRDLALYEQHAEFLQLASKFVYQPLYSFGSYPTPRYYSSMLELWRYVREGHFPAKSAYILERLADFRNELDALYKTHSGFNNDSDERDGVTLPLIEEFRKNIGRIATALENPQERHWLRNWAGTLN